MNAPESAGLLEACKKTAEAAGKALLESENDSVKSYAYSEKEAREIKAVADMVLEERILKSLLPLNIPILSEESGLLPRDAGEREMLLVVDPLDGTFNFVRGAGPSAVSIGLWNGEEPLFGVIYHLAERQLYWGGRQFGAWRGDRPLRVSKIATRSQACVCTGFPARLDLSDDNRMRGFLAEIRPFAKVRMLGSAAVSLLLVAQGAAEAYSEREIMLWDVAAGLAIVEGAGGAYALHRGARKWAYDVAASNGLVQPIPADGGAR